MMGTRIWDLRRGDDDDNRSSPPGGSFHALILPTIMELNYLKASLSLLILIIGPAILLGLGLSVVATYWQFVSHATSATRQRSVFGIGSLTVLLMAALWLGRRFVSAVVGNARHLHYSLIFPVFVTLREVLQTIGARIGRGSAGAERLWKRRRLATILAALMFCVAGLALGLTVEVSAGLKLVNVERVSFWATAKSALGNAAIVLGFSTVFESSLWLWRELRLTKPVLDWVGEPTVAEASTLRVAHLSDLHLLGDPYGFRIETGIRGPRGNRRFRNAIRKLRAIHAQAPLDRILVTGDVTDAGTRAEWLAFVNLLRECREFQQRLSFVPGNHDVNIVDRNNPGRFDMPWSASIALRKLRFVLTLDAIQGERTYVVDRSSLKLGPTLREYLRVEKRASILCDLAQRGSIMGRIEIAKVWRGLFPLVEPASSDHGCGLILLDSNAPAHFSLTNAIGVVNPTQLRALKTLLSNFPSARWIIMLHHQVVEYPDASIPLRDRVGLALVNAPELLATIVPHASRVIILHGHRHRDWIGTYGDVVLCSAPSVTLGAEESEEDQGIFHIHQIELEKGGKIRLTSTRRLKVA